MKRGLYSRLVIAFIGITSGILLISTISFIISTHYHFTLFQHQAEEINTAAFDIHFEQALIQSILWTFIISIIIAVIVSLFVAKRITSPLIHMKKIAEQMARGNLHVRTSIHGDDELTDLGHSLNYLAEQLQHQENLRKTMTADVAHELRTPLATLKSHMIAMLDGVWEPTPKRLEACYEEVERLTLLVGDLAKLTEIESPNFKLELQEEDLASIVNQGIEASKAAFFEKGIQLVYKHRNPILLNLDRNRVAQIITNLLSNALKYTQSGGEVSVQIKDDVDAARIIVCDTGIGIKADEIPLVFERFYRGEKSRNRKTGGAGIGLSIVKAIVEAHKGKIDLESIEGKGTEVTVYFPK